MKQTIIVYQSSDSDNSMDVFASLRDAIQFASNNFNEFVAKEVECSLKEAIDKGLLGHFYSYDKERNISFSFITRTIKGL